jgi:Outer membrane protein beta-barrel domain
MRRILGVLVVTLVCASPAMAVDFKIFGSYWNTNDLSNTAGGGIGLGFPLGASPLSIAVSGTYYRQLSDRPLHNLFDDNTNQTFFSRNSIRVTPIDAQVQWHFPTGGTVEPWIGAGATYFLLSSSRSGLDFNDETGWNAGAGLRIGQRQGANFFADAIYRNTKATVRRHDESVSLVDRESLSLDGFGVNAGFLWHW